MAPDGFRERDIRAPRKGLRLLALELFDARRGQRQRLHIDARRVHRRDPAIADVNELIDERREPSADLFGALLQPPVRTVEKGGGGEVLLERDHAHCRSPSRRRSGLARLSSTENRVATAAPRRAASVKPRRY